MVGLNINANMKHNNQKQEHEMCRKKVQTRFILIKYEYKDMKRNKQICYKNIPQIDVEQIERNERGLLLFVLVSELVEKNFFNIH
jgi:hypothetical protein